MPSDPRPARAPGRLAIVLWSAVPGLVVGLLAGGGLWSLFSLARLLAPSLTFLQRAAPVVAVVCLALIPLAGAALGALEGWLKRR